MRFFKTAKLIRNNLTIGAIALVTACFLESYIASIGLKSSNGEKEPEDIVWERARNLGNTKSSIQDFQLEQIKYLIPREMSDNIESI